MSEQKQSEIQKIARERVFWALKVVMLAFIICWWLTPEVTRPEVVDKSVLWGFLAGASFAIIANRQVFNALWSSRLDKVRHYKNRLPDEYYFGKVEQVLFRER